MSIRLDGTLVSTTMRTPGHDFELAVGFCFTEGLLDGAPVTGVRYCATAARSTPSSTSSPSRPGPGADADTAARQHVVELWHLRDANSSTTSPTASRRSPPTEPFDLALLHVVPDLVAERPAPVRRAPARVTPPRRSIATVRVLVVREDIGRHNAVDKVVGRMLLEGRPGDGLGLCVSGRASFEMVQKAWAAGFATLVSVSAPTALAVEAARRAPTSPSPASTAPTASTSTPDRLSIPEIVARRAVRRCVVSRIFPRMSRASLSVGVMPVSVAHGEKGSSDEFAASDHRGDPAS